MSKQIIYPYSTFLYHFLNTAGASTPTFTPPFLSTVSLTLSMAQCQWLLTLSKARGIEFNMNPVGCKQVSLEHNALVCWHTACSNVACTPKQCPKRWHCQWHTASSNMF